ncbi:MAG TPA: RDD family protein [Acidobacteriota bacterium]|nr:RDD family protein [Acidobacteriota bacterium]
MDWKSEIKKKLEEHAQKKHDLEDSSGGSDPQDQEPQQTPAQQHAEAGRNEEEPSQQEASPAGAAPQSSPDSGSSQDSEVTVSLGQRPTVKRRPTTFLRDQPLEIETPAGDSQANRQRPEEGDASPPEEKPAPRAGETDSGLSFNDSRSAAETAAGQEVSSDEPEGHDDALEALSGRGMAEGADTPLQQPDIPPETGEQQEERGPYLADPEVPASEARREEADPAAGVKEPQQPTGAGPAEPLAEDPPSEDIGRDGEADPDLEQDANDQDPGDIPLQMDLLERDLRPDRDKDQPGERQHSIVTFEERSQAEPSPLDRPLRGRGQEEPDDSERWKAAFEPSDEKDEEEDARLDQTSAYADDFPDEDLDEADNLWVPREIFISRALAGLVDLILAAFTGLLFAAGASRVLGFSLLDPAALQIAGGMALVFLIVSSVFFLRLASQTPGMHLAKLKALHQESPEIPTGAAVIRVLAFLPSLGLLFAGLLWGLFDPWARCLHDRLSQTRVVVADRH